MNELKEKRKELEYEIWELETESQKLLNFGNVPLMQVVFTVAVTMQNRCSLSEKIGTITLLNCANGLGLNYPIKLESRFSVFKWVVTFTAMPSWAIKRTNFQ